MFPETRLKPAQVLFGLEATCSKQDKLVFHSCQGRTPRETPPGQSDKNRGLDKDLDYGDNEDDD